MRHLGKSSLWTALLLLMWFENNVTGTDNRDPSQQGKAHSRQKRLLWITNDGRLALPPGTRLTITPSLSLPFVRYPPDGFLSNMSISLPFTSEFTKKNIFFFLLSNLTRISFSPRYPRRRPRISTLPMAERLECRYNCILFNVN